jgi:hypothetical protein
MEEGASSCADSEDSNAEGFYTHEYPDEDESGDSSSRASDKSRRSESGSASDSF